MNDDVRAADRGHSPHRGYEPALPAALPALDLTKPHEKRGVAKVDLSTAALQAGVQTKTCPQCGLNPATTMAKRRFMYVPPWVYAGLAINIIILAVLYIAGRRIVDGHLSLCADCDAADRRARTLQSLSVGGLVLFPMLMAGVAGFVLGIEAGLMGAAAGFVAGLAGIVAAHRHTKPFAARSSTRRRARRRSWPVIPSRACSPGRIHAPLESIDGPPEAGELHGERQTRSSAALTSSGASCWTQCVAFSIIRSSPSSQ